MRCCYSTRLHGFLNPMHCLDVKCQRVDRPCQLCRGKQQGTKNTGPTATMVLRLGWARAPIGARGRCVLVRPRQPYFDLSILRLAESNEAIMKVEV
jgi:hypothetical protein